MATVTEVLGSGDGTLANQSFILKQKPLTYLPAANAQGVSSTLEIRVNNVLWHEVPTLFGVASNEQCYVLQQVEDGTVRILFGDGLEGARLPTGQENIAANYRIGLGLSGEVDAGTLTLLQTRPLGIRSVTNPLPATGAADPEILDDARRNAPLTVLTLERIVSFKDFESFVQAYPGIAKVKAALLKPKNKNPFIHLTISGVNGETIDPQLTLYTNLVNAISNACLTGQKVVLKNYEPLQFDIKASLQINPDYKITDVINNVRTQLLTQFGFNARHFGQDVTASEILQLIQSIPGVVAVDLQILKYKGTPDRLNAKLTADTANIDHPAQLLTINPNGINLEGILL